MLLAIKEVFGRQPFTTNRHKIEVTGYTRAMARAGERERNAIQSFSKKGMVSAYKKKQKKYGEISGLGFPGKNGAKQTGKEKVLREAHHKERTVTMSPMARWRLQNGPLRPTVKPDRLDRRTSSVQKKKLSRKNKRRKISKTPGP